MSKRETIPADLLSVYDIMFMFKIGIVSVYRFRGTEDLPFIKIPGSAHTPAIRYSLRAVVKWSKESNHKIVNLPTHKDGTITYRRKAKFRKFLKKAKFK